MPIDGMLADERVNSPGNSQPVSNERIRVNIFIIIVVNEVVTDSLAENEPRYCNEKNGDTNRARDRPNSLFYSRF